MSKSLIIASSIFLIIIILVILRFVNKRKISIKYSLIWILPCIILLLFILIPGFMVSITKLLGFQTASNMVLTALIGFLFVVNITLTIIVTNQKDKIRLLIQEVSIIKEEIHEKK